MLWIFSKLCESCERIEENPNCESGLFKSGGFFLSFWRGNLRDGDHYKDPGVDGELTLKWIFMNWIGVTWLRMGAGGGIL